MISKAATAPTRRSSSADRRSRPRGALAACLGVFLGATTACVPWPHHQQRAPAIFGVVRTATGPKAGVRVHRVVNTTPRSAAGQCLGDEVEVTDTQGRFAFEAKRNLLFFFIFGDRRDTWHLCFEPEPGAPGQASVWTGTGWWGGPKAETLTCTVETPDAITCYPQAR